LKEALLHTAQELAHRASIYGVVRVSYRYLGVKCHCSKRTAMRHIQRLIDAGIIRKSVIWIRGNYCEVNTYRFRIAWDKRPSREVSNKPASKSPPPSKGEKKYASLAEKQRLAARGLSSLTPGSALYVLVAERQT